MNILQKTTLAGVTVAMLILMGSGAAMAEPAAIIKDDGLCGMPGADANGNFIFGGVGQVTHVVENGNTIVFTCKGTGLTNLSGRGQNFNSFLRGVISPYTLSGEITDDTHATVAANGNGTMTCVVDKT
jgi:hypothetical protein